jgi:hypothetical protein
VAITIDTAMNKPVFIWSANGDWLARLRQLIHEAFLGITHEMEE